MEQSRIIQLSGAICIYSAVYCQARCWLRSLCCGTSFDYHQPIHLFIALQAMYSGLTHRVHQNIVTGHHGRYGMVWWLHSLGYNTLFYSIRLFPSPLFALPIIPSLLYSSYFMNLYTIYTPYIITRWLLHCVYIKWCTLCRLYLYSEMNECLMLTSVLYCTVLVFDSIYR